MAGTWDEEKYSRTNRWLAQMAETSAAFKEYVDSQNEQDWDRFVHHRVLLEKVLAERRLPDSFEQAIAEQLEMYRTVSDTMVSLFNQAI